MNLQDEFNRAIGDEEIDLVRSLLYEDVDVNKLNRHQWTPLMVAAECESEEIALLLLERGAEINARGFEGNTPLHIAVDMAIDGTIQSGGKLGDEPTNVVLTLLTHGADLNAKNDRGETPLDWANGYRSQKIIEILVGKNS